MTIVRPEEHGPLEVPMPEGYPKMGLLMGKCPEYAILRRFGALNAENLLYLQAELKVLETKLRMYQEADRNSGHDERKIYSLDWETLENSGNNATTTSGNDGNQWKTILTIREKLKEYSTLPSISHSFILNQQRDRYGVIATTPDHEHSRPGSQRSDIS